MEQEDIKAVWKELNERVNASVWHDKKTLAYLLRSRRKTTWQKMIAIDRTVLLFFVLVTGVSGYVLFGERAEAPLILRIQAMILLLTATAFNAVAYFQLSRMSLDGPVLTLYKQIASYKRHTVWSYLVVYALVIVFIVTLFAAFPLPPGARLAVCLIIPVGVAIDCFVYHWTSGCLHTLTDTTNELKELDGLD